jgi:hypothetical protein
VHQRQQQQQQQQQQHLETAQSKVEQQTADSRESANQGGQGSDESEKVIQKVLKRRNSMHLRRKKEARRQIVREQKELRDRLKKKNRRIKVAPEVRAQRGQRLLDIAGMLDFPANALRDIRW